ncbi:hypothetical protein VM57_06850 [Stenotrophomonas maltophilia]|uniref:Transmembrane anchor protein n=1 Tax=Stenotrophomonas maltophilia TaxID=40324 RepID=A0A0F5ZP39_STEMA|nr:hypothetical protein VM57_06850 [Stenotrophomonas maltophilia]
MPSSKQLFRSTIIAAVSAAVILITVVLPAEYGIDPTGVGRVLRLTEMGEIKNQLAAEAASDAEADAKKAMAGAPSVAEMGQQSRPANVPEEAPQRLHPPALRLLQQRSLSRAGVTRRASRWHPAKGLNQLRMKEGAEANFAWAVEGAGAVNFDTHGDGGGRSISYEKGRGVPSDKGTLVAASPAITAGSGAIAAMLRWPWCCEPMETTSTFSVLDGLGHASIAHARKVGIAASPWRRCPV